MKLLGDRIYRLDGLDLIPSKRLLAARGEPLPVRSQSFDVLVCLVENCHRLVTKEELLETVWRGMSVGDDSLVQCITDLRKVLGDNARNPRFIRTITKAGYQFIGTVDEIAPAVTDSLLPSAFSVTLEEIAAVQVKVDDQDGTMPSLLPGSPRWLRKASLWISIIALALVLSGISLALRLAHPEPSTTLPQVAGNHPVLVLFFENQSHSQDIDWLREGLADMVIADLSRAPRLNVLSRQQVATLLDRTGWKSGGGLRLDDALAVAKRAGARALVLGTFARFGNSVRVTAQVHSARDGVLVQTETATAERPEHIIGLMGLLALKLARDLGSEPVHATNAGAIPMTGNLEAYHAYSVGVERVGVLKLPEGIRLLERAVQLDPQFAAAYAALGNAYSVTWGRAPEGKPYLEKAFTLSGRLTGLQRMYVAAWYALANEDFADAIRAFQRIVARYPSEAEAYCSLGRLLEGEGRYGEAIEAERQALVVDPDAPLVHLFLARVYCRAGRFQEGVTESKRYIELTGGEPNAYDSLGSSYVWQGRYAEAEAAYRAALARKPDFDVALVHLAAVHYRQGRYRDAITEVQQYLRIASADLDQSRGNAWLAWIHLRRGDLVKAREASLRESKLSGPLAWFSRELIALQSGDLATARKALETAGSVPERGNRGSDRYRPYARGLLALASGRRKEAIANYQQVLGQPEPVGFVDWFDDCLGDGYLRLGQLDEAIAEYRRVLARNPNTALARYHLAVALAGKGDSDNARVEYRRFIDTWKQADLDIAELRHAKTALLRLAVPTASRPTHFQQAYRTRDSGG